MSSEWIPVTERLPMKEELVLGFGINGPAVVTYRPDYWDKGEDAWTDSEWLDTPVTHWMPLPKPPEGAK